VTKDKFWELVAKINWPNLCDTIEKRPYRTGKKILLEFLPSIDLCEQFREWHDQLYKELHDVLWAYHEEQMSIDPNWTGWGTGDDGFSDLINHIIGCGSQEYNQTLGDPTRAVARVSKWNRNGGGNPARSNGYVESFSYCIPKSEDYDPTEVKLTRALDGLNHWHEQKTAERRVSPPWVQEEIERRIKTVAELEYKLKLESGGTADDTLGVEQIANTHRCRIAKMHLAKLLDKRIKLEMEIKEAQETLEQLVD